MSTSTAVIEHPARADREAPTVTAVTVKQTMEALKTIREFVAGEMRDGLDYGLIPGTGGKKTMLLPGAQKVGMLYNCCPRYTVETTELPGGHVEFRVHTELVNRATDSVVGAGLGSCSTMESKYRWRNAARKCPRCGKEAIIKGKAEYGGGWVCFKKKDGCGATFRDDDQAVAGQVAGRVENPDIYDVRNTVLKIAKKRSLVDASLGLGCLAELFTQDLDEMVPEDEPEPAPAPRRKEQPAPQQAVDGAPRDGVAFEARVKRGEQAMIEAGLCQYGELFTFLRVEGAKRDLPQRLIDWPMPDAWAAAVEMKGQFEGICRGKQRVAG